MNLRLLFAAALFFAAPVRAQAQEAKPLFASSDPVALTIRAPLSTFSQNRQTNAPISGTLTDPAGQALPITLSLRGITRRTADTCEFPPLRVDFIAPPPPNSLFAGQRKLKLVTHCRNSAAFQKYVLLEYAAYKMYNLLTPHSFGARLVTINYQDASGRPMMTRAGFFIEDLKDVARRNGTAEVHAGDRIPTSFLNPADAARYAMFQHMIGNHDWSMRAGPAGDDCCHNAKLIGAAGQGASIPIPYDFDFSGLVGAPYATPPEQLGISDVRQRVYRGYCMHNPQALAAARQMRDAAPQIIGTLSAIPGLPDGARSTAAAYLRRFFADIQSDEQTSTKVLKQCLG